MASNRKRSVDSDDSDVGRVAACMASTGRQWNSFLKFLWNPAEKTVLGRGGKSWIQILIFYAIYYSFLAALFAVAITIVLGTLDPYTPRFQTRLQAPGLSVQPKEPSSLSLSSDIKFTENDKTSYEKYTAQLQKVLDSYANQGDTKFYQNCTNGKIHINQEFTKDETARACMFNPMEELGNCAKGEFGYAEGKPCIYVKVNRIVGWFPVGFTDLSEATGNSASKAPNLAEILLANNIQYDPYRMYIACYGEDPTDQKNLNGKEGVSANTVYYPRQHGMPFKYYPYYGKKRCPQYKTPIVAVQFTKVTKNVDIKVACKAYAANIVDSQRMQIGYYTFILRVDAKKE